MLGVILFTFANQVESDSGVKRSNAYRHMRSIAIPTLISATIEGDPKFYTPNSSYRLLLFRLYHRCMSDFQE
jgi:hypothetical protein